MLTWKVNKTKEKFPVSTESAWSRKGNKWFSLGHSKQPYSLHVSWCTLSLWVSDTYMLCLWVPLTQFGVWPGFHISPAFCVSCYFISYFKDTLRFLISRSFKQSCRATNREKKRLTREKCTCRKITSSVSHKPGDIPCSQSETILVMKCNNTRKRDLLPAKCNPAAIPGHRENGLSIEGPWCF